MTIAVSEIPAVFEEAVPRMKDEGHTVDVIYLDFAKAFDSVNHRFILAKLKSLVHPHLE